MTGDHLQKATIIEVELEKILLNPAQPRKYFAKEELKSLAQSLESVGLIQPPNVKRHPKEGFFELISGERRLLAAKIAGWKKIRVIVNQESAHESALIENIQRVDLNAIEIAESLKDLMKLCGDNQEKLARRCGLKRSTVANYLRLLSLPEEIQKSLLSKHISMGHAKAILSATEPAKQLKLYTQVVKKDLSVRQTERMAKLIEKEPSLALEGKKTCFLDTIKKEMEERLGTKVTVQGRGEKGKIIIDYYTLDDLDRILELFGISTD